MNIQEFGEESPDSRYDALFVNGWMYSYLRGWTAAETQGESEDGQNAPTGLEWSAYLAGIHAAFASFERDRSDQEEVQ